MTEILISSPTDLPAAARDFLSRTKGHKVFVFVAEMGAGKTTFILSVLREMGIEEVEGSPTYSLVNEYDSPEYGRVYHLDLYRLKNEEEAYNIGIEEIIYGDAVCFIEWPEKIKDLLPDNTIWSYIRKQQDERRTLKIDL